MDGLHPGVDTSSDDTGPMTPDFTAPAPPGAPTLPGGFGVPDPVAEFDHGASNGGGGVPSAGGGELPGGSSWMNNFNNGGGAAPAPPLYPEFPTPRPPTGPTGPVTPVAPVKVPCTNDLWMFDTTTLVWSSHSFTQHVHEVEAHASPGDSTASAQHSWPAAECGASAIRDASS